MTLNPFVENNKARINQFLNNLCEVGDFYDTLEVTLLRSHSCDRSDADHGIADGPIHGPLKERPDDPHYSERVVQYTFLDFTTHRDAGTCFFMCFREGLAAHRRLSPSSRRMTNSISVS